MPPATNPMRADTLPAAAGWHWVRGGFTLFRANPGFLNFLWFSTWLMVMGVSLLPLIGQAIGSLVMPGLLVGILNGCRAIDRGEKLDLAMVFSGFKAARASVLRIGMIYLVVSSLVFALSLMLTSDTLEPLLSGKTSPTEVDPVVAAQLLMQLVITLQVALVLSSPTLVAAPLAAWYGLSVSKALFFAMIGIVRNVLPLTVLYLALLLLSFGLPYVLASVIGEMPAIVKTLGQLALMFALAFVFMPTAFASFYLAIRDIFQPDGEPSPPRDDAVA